MPLQVAQLDASGESKSESTVHLTEVGETCGVTSEEEMVRNKRSKDAFRYRDYEATENEGAMAVFPGKELIAGIGLEDSVNVLIEGVTTWSLTDLPVRRERVFENAGGKSAAYRQAKHRWAALRRTLVHHAPATAVDDASAQLDD